MKAIKDLVDLIDEELEGAKNYAETYLTLKAENEQTFASKFKTMASDELTHALNIHEYAVSKINELKKVYTPPVEMEEAWNKSHKAYIEQTAWIKQMLAM